jgi:hypothetical protein
MTITGRSSSLTNAFFNAIIPVMRPTADEERKALEILALDPANLRCAYCGDKSTEWDHLRPLITDQKPTGYITEIANLVPSCGKCNQSKGKSEWRIWITSTARLSPKTRGVPDLEARIERLSAYEQWRRPRKIDFEAIAGPELWRRHQQNWRDVLDQLRKSQELASEIRDAIVKATKEP